MMKPRSINRRSAAGQFSRRFDNPSFNPDVYMRRPGARVGLVAAIAWTFAWKSASMWRAAKNDSKPWFAVLLVSNTLGILDAVYLFGVDGARRRHEQDEKAIRSVTGEPEQLGHRQET